MYYNTTRTMDRVIWYSWADDQEYVTVVNVDGYYPGGSIYEDRTVPRHVSDYGDYN